MSDELENPLIMMSFPGELRFSAEGDWLHDGQAVTNAKIAKYFSQHLGFSPQHNSHVIEVEGKCVSVVVEDKPQLAIAIDFAQKPWRLELTNGRVVEFLADSLQVNSQQIFYCRGLGLAELIRLKRTTVQQLSPYISEGKDGNYLLTVGLSRYPIAVI